jgi:predicted flap endonuclease-1-like 5' DNA nuclease
MNYRIDEIEGIGPAYRETLSAAGITTTGDFLTRCGGAPGRKEAAAATGLSEVLLLKWANLADLMRINGVGPQYSELLEASGVDTVKELRTRNAENLAVRMEATNAQKRLAGAVPAASVIQGWIEEAKTLEPRISH